MDDALSWLRSRPTGISVPQKRLPTPFRRRVETYGRMRVLSSGKWSQSGKGNRHGLPSFLGSKTEPICCRARQKAHHGKAQQRNAAKKTRSHGTRNSRIFTDQTKVAYPGIRKSNPPSLNKDLPQKKDFAGLQYRKCRSGSVCGAPCISMVRCGEEETIRNRRGNREVPNGAERLGKR